MKELLMEAVDYDYRFQDQVQAWWPMDQGKLDTPQEMLAPGVQVQKSGQTSSLSMGTYTKGCSVYIWVRAWDLEPVFKSWLSQTLQLWASDLISLCFSFLICNTRLLMIVFNFGFVESIKWIDIYKALWIVPDTWQALIVCWNLSYCYY